MTQPSSSQSSEAVMRGATALCRFIFPGYVVMREEMARAVLAAAADEGEDWMTRLPPKHVAVGQAAQAREAWEVLRDAPSVTEMPCECENRPNEYRSRSDGLWHCVNCDGRVEPQP